jgi:hypothetical protein
MASAAMPGPPNINGGNMDNRHLCVGATIFYPVAVQVPIDTAVCKYTSKLLVI